MKKHTSSLFILFIIVAAICAFYYSSTAPAHAGQDGQVKTATTRTAQTSQQSAASGYKVVGSPTINEYTINNVLCAAHSPACGTGAALYDLGVKYGIDPAFALAFFNHESNYGTQGVARASLSLGNLRCIDNARCVNNYAYFDTWAQGYEAWYVLISGPLYVGDGLITVEQIIPRYAPPADNNDDSAYIAGVEQEIDALRTAA